MSTYNKVIEYDYNLKIQFIDENTTWNNTHKYIADVLVKLGIKPYKNIRTFL